MEEFKKKPYIIGAIIIVLIGGIYYMHKQSAKKARVKKRRESVHKSRLA